MPNTAVKICGITRREDALAAVAAGATAIGLVFYPPSKRNISIEQALDIVTAIPPFVSVVGLFVDMPEDNVQAILDKLPLSLLQFHGSEDAGYCRSFKRPYIKAVKFRTGGDATEHQQYARDNCKTLLQAVDHYHDARGLLLDVYDEREAGGTGKAFDWQQIPGNVEKPIILAGGLNVENVASAVHCVSPYAVDVSSGVESSPGIKSDALIKQFIAAAQSA